MKWTLALALAPCALAAGCDLSRPVPTPGDHGADASDVVVAIDVPIDVPPHDAHTTGPSDAGTIIPTSPTDPTGARPGAR
jgi:hypothetical protein